MPDNTVWEANRVRTTEFGAPSGAADTPSDLMVIPADTCTLDEPVGLGVRTRGFVSAGSIVAVFGGTATSAADFALLDDATRSRSIQVGDLTYLVPGPAFSPALLINHSCEPNCRLAGEVTLVAAYDIGPGELLTYDYATSDASPYDEFDCHCGSTGCRQRVTGSDWRRPDLQERYAGWFSPYLQRKIEIRRSMRPHDRSDLVQI